jgi:hypothetical protein
VQARACMASRPDVSTGKSTPGIALQNVVQLATQNDVVPLGRVVVQREAEHRFGNLQCHVAPSGLACGACTDAQYGYSYNSAAYHASGAHPQQPFLRRPGAHELLQSCQDDCELARLLRLGPASSKPQQQWYLGSGTLGANSTHAALQPWLRGGIREYTQKCMHARCAACMTLLNPSPGLQRPPGSDRAAEQR